MLKKAVVYLCLAIAVSSLPLGGSTYMRPKPGFGPRFERAGGSIGAFARTPDGGFYAAGSFSSFGEQMSAGIVRFKADGTLDHAFRPDDLSSGSVDYVCVQASGKIVIAGRFSIVGGVARGNLARLLPDGSLDRSFHPTGGYPMGGYPPITGGGEVYGLASFDDGGVLVVGNFAGGEYPSRSIVRLRDDGSVDQAFKSGTGFGASGIAHVVHPLEGGKILVGGTFTSYNGTPCSTLIRLMPDGTLDPSFVFADAEFVSVTSALIGSDGNIVIGGAPRTGFQIRFARLHSDGSVDPTFPTSITSTFSNRYLRSVLDFFPDGDILFGAQGGLQPDQSALIRFNPDGTRDTAFRYPSSNGEIRRAAITWPDGTVVVDGPLFLRADGAVNPNIAFQLRTPGDVFVLERDPNGGWLAAGQFDFVDGLPRTDVVRIDQDGHVDPLFVPSGGVQSYASITCLAVQPDGKTLVGGGFTEFSGTAAGGIVRLNRDGSVDGTFVTGSGFTLGEYNGVVSAISVQDDGRILVGGNFSTYNGTSRSWIARLMPNGELDTSFPTGSGFDGAVYDIILDEAGRAVVSGSFTSFSSRARPGLLRLRADGLLDESFTPVLPSALGVSSIALGVSGEVFVAGTVDGYANVDVVRLKGDGSLDTGFASGGPRMTDSRAVLTVDTSGAAYLGLGLRYMEDLLTRFTAAGRVDEDFVWLGSNPEIGHSYIHALVSSDDELGVAGRWLSLGRRAGCGFIVLEPIPGPELVSPPVNAAVAAGNAVTLSVSVSSDLPVSYQWTYAGAEIPGATGATLRMPIAQAFNTGSYGVVVRSAVGVAQSQNVSVTVSPPAPSNARVLNLSTRALDLTGDNQLIPGFVISGTGTKRMLIRAVGPGLSDTFGLQGSLLNPRMRLTRGGIDLVANDDWSSSADKDAIIAAFSAVGAFPLVDGSKDAALLVELPPGVYSAPTEGADGATGIAMVELYDADTTPSGCQLVNISNRGYVDVGDKIMIPGFVVSQEGARTFLIRAVGPGLGTTFGLGGVLANPVLTVFQGGTPVLQQDDWSTSAGAATTELTARQVGAFPLVSGSGDAAFVVTLPPGPYTVQATGKSGTKGVALVEIYVVP